MLLLGILKEGGEISPLIPQSCLENSRTQKCESVGCLAARDSATSGILRSGTQNAEREGITVVLWVTHDTRHQTLLSAGVPHTLEFIGRT
jgi:hypothetical protein